MQVVLVLVVVLLALVIGRVYKRGRRIMAARELVTAHTTEAIAELRAMALTHPKSCRFYLAAGLNNLATRQGLLGQDADALRSMLEATAIIRNLSQGNPSLEGYLAQFLAGLSGRHHVAGEQDRALAAGRESVELWRKIAKANADFVPDLALGLMNLSAAQDGEEALASSAEAVRLIRPLIESGPTVLLGTLAGSLASLGGAQLALRQLSESVTTMSEAVAIRRQLAASEPATMAPHLAGALNTLGAAQSELGEHEKSAASLNEALQILRGLVKEHSNKHLDVLAGCLMNLAVTYRKGGRPADALEPAREAVSLCSSLAEACPPAHSARMRDAVGLLREVLTETGADPSNDESLARAEALDQRLRAGS